MEARVCTPRVVHATADRVRINVPDWPGHTEAALEEGLRRTAGVQRAQANALTGNILINFDPTATDAASLLATVSAVTLGGADEEARSPDHAAPARRAYLMRERRNGTRGGRDSAGTASRQDAATLVCTAQHDTTAPLLGAAGQDNLAHLLRPLGNVLGIGACLVGLALAGSVLEFVADCIGLLRLCSELLTWYAEQQRARERMTYAALPDTGRQTMQLRPASGF